MRPAGHICRHSPGSSFGYRSPTPVMDAAHEFIVAKLEAQRYSALVDQPGMGYVRIARTLSKEALKQD